VQAILHSVRACVCVCVGRCELWKNGRADFDAVWKDWSVSSKDVPDILRCHCHTGMDSFWGEYRVIQCNQSEICGVVMRESIELPFVVMVRVGPKKDVFMGILIRCWKGAVLEVLMPIGFYVIFLLVGSAETYLIRCKKLANISMEFLLFGLSNNVLHYKIQVGIAEKFANI